MEKWMLQRYSCRKYKDQVLRKDELQCIDAWKSQFQFPMHIPLDWAATVIEDGALIQETFKGIINRYVRVDAPHYLMLSSSNAPNDSFLVGFLGESFVKFMTEQGYGTCWLGHHLSSEAALDLGMPPHHRYRILIAFGYENDTEENLKERPKSKRKSLQDIGFVDLESDLWLYEALRCAPSAVNTQPWFLEHREGHFHYYLKSKTVVKYLLKEKNYIDLGIGFYHIYDAIKGKGYRMTWQFEGKPTKLGEYILSFKHFE